MAEFGSPWRKSLSGWRVGVDVGGTFTDVALVEERSGRLIVRKVPTTPEDPVKGVLSGVKASLEDAGVGPGEVSYFGAGTTLALNTVIQHRLCLRVTHDRAGCLSEFGGMLNSQGWPIAHMSEKNNSAVTSMIDNGRKRP